MDITSEIIFVYKCLQLLQQMEALDVRLNDDIEYFLEKYKENGTGLFIDIFVVWLRGCYGTSFDVE